MPDIYGQTLLSPEGVTANSGFVTWEEQPSPFKRYPDFLPRYTLETLPLLRALRVARTVTDIADFEGTPYRRLSTPSAGNLHPLELYVQIRGVEGIPNGIYHLDALHDVLVRIEEIGAGFETMMGYANRFEGVLILLSLVPYRSEWKYGHRAWRYCFMDAGHQVGTLLNALNSADIPFTVPPAFDREALERFMGFGDQEYACMVLACGSEGTRRARKPSQPLMQVMPTDYCRSDGTVGRWIAQSDTPKLKPEALLSDADTQTQLARRSARKFSGLAMPDTLYEHILHLLVHPPEGMTSYAVVLEPLREQGVFRNGTLLNSGMHAEIVAALLVGQRFVMEGSIVMILTAPNYSVDLQLHAAAFGHKLSLDAAQRGGGYTAIGAFYDRELQAFLETDDAVLYVGVFGME